MYCKEVLLIAPYINYVNTTLYKSGSMFIEAKEKQY